MITSAKNPSAPRALPNLLYDSIMVCANSVLTFRLTATIPPNALYVALVCLAVSHTNILVNSTAAGIEVLYDYRRRLIEFLNQLKRRV